MQLVQFIMITAAGCNLSSHAQQCFNKSPADTIGSAGYYNNFVFEIGGHAVKLLLQTYFKNFHSGSLPMKKPLIGEAL
jgi:hypothetical protein